MQKISEVSGATIFSGIFTIDSLHTSKTYEPGGGFLSAHSPLLTVSWFAVGMFKSQFILLSPILFSSSSDVFSWALILQKRVRLLRYIAFWGWPPSRLLILSWNVLSTLKLFWSSLFECEILIHWRMVQERQVGPNYSTWIGGSMEWVRIGLTKSTHSVLCSMYCKNFCPLKFRRERALPRLKTIASGTKDAITPYKTSLIQLLTIN